MGGVGLGLHSFFTSEVIGQHHAPAALPAERTIVPQSVSVLFGRQKNLLRLPGIEPRIIQPVASSLYRLSYPLPSYVMHILIFFS
jgi:hypothetical protein